MYDTDDKKIEVTKDNLDILIAKLSAKLNFKKEEQVDITLVIDELREIRNFLD